MTPYRRPSGTARSLLLVAAAIVWIEAVMCLVLAGLGAADTSRDRIGPTIGVTLILAVYGVFQAWAAWRLTEGDHWARSPLIVTQIIQLIIAFNLADVSSLITGSIAAAAAITLVCLLAPPVTRALSIDDPV